MLLSFNQYKELMQQQQNSLNQFEIGEDIEVDITSFITQQSHSQNGDNQDKFNYASMDCMANVVETSRNNVKHSSNLLSNDMDKSLLFNYNKDNCKYVIIELCDLIKITSLEIGNLEHFSNNFKRFSLSGKKWYSNNKNKDMAKNGNKNEDSGDEGWIHIGTFDYTAPNSIQFFCVNETKVSRPWVKYLRLEILEVDENVDDYYYTPITVFRVFGKDIFNDVEETEREMIQNQLLQESDKKIKEEKNKSSDINSETTYDLTGFGETSDVEFDFCAIKNPFLKYDKKLDALNKTDNPTNNNLVVAKIDYKDNVLESILKKINFLTSYTQLQSSYMELSFNETVNIINDTYFNSFKKKVSTLEKQNAQLSSRIESINDHVRGLTYCLCVVFTITVYLFLEKLAAK